MEETLLKRLLWTRRPDGTRIRLSAVAGLLGCDPTDLSHWAAGRRAVPSKWRKRLSGVLEVEPEKLFDERGLAKYAESDEPTK